jgi:methanol--5-hydroxybenzimidazolylcobamide Co-methyltransferase
VELALPGLLVELETLPPMTVTPQWGLEVTRVVAAELSRAHEHHQLPCALRLTPNDTREHQRPPQMRRGRYWDGMLELIDGAAAAGAHLLAIESTGGKEVCDEALVLGDLRTIAFALGVLAPADMDFLWSRLVDICERDGILPSGDTACGFANTAMVLADQGMIPRVLAAVVRVATVPRSLVAYERGAVGPSKDCAYEGPYMKCICGVPISMEGRSAACAHLSPVGNIAQAVCDAWSNESVQNVRLLSAKAPIVSLEHLAYDCRLLNAAARGGRADAGRLRDWLVESDAHLDPQAFVLRPDVVIELAGEIMQEQEPYARTRRAIRATLSCLRQAAADGEVVISERERGWLERLSEQAERLPADPGLLWDEVLATDLRDRFLPAEYGF